MSNGNSDFDKSQISDLIQDIILQFIEEDEFTGKLLEEAILEAMQDIASYFSGRAQCSEDLLKSYLALRLNAHEEDGADCSSGCDI
jgi:hypothetical protein